MQTPRTLMNADKNEPRHDKTNKMTCMPGEDSDQPGIRPI